MADSWYEEKEILTNKIVEGSHRDMIGGMWDQIGELQFQALVQRGLKPHHTLIDVGCGSLRGGVKFIEYLEPLKYYGTDINTQFIQAGFDNELNASQRQKLGRQSFRVSDHFDFEFNVPHFDFGIAVSVFTHLSENKIKLCLHNLRKKFDGGCFYATFFKSDHTKYNQPIEQIPGLQTYSFMDPYHYTVDEIARMAELTGWGFNWIGDIGHPRNQQLAEFTS